MSTSIISLYFQLLMAVLGYPTYSASSCTVFTSIIDKHPKVMSMPVHSRRSDQSKEAARYCTLSSFVMIAHLLVLRCWSHSNMLGQGMTGGLIIPCGLITVDKTFPQFISTQNRFQILYSANCVAGMDSEGEVRIGGGARYFFFPPSFPHEQFELHLFVSSAS